MCKIPSFALITWGNNLKNRLMISNLPALPKLYCQGVRVIYLRLAKVRTNTQASGRNREVITGALARSYNNYTVSHFLSQIGSTTEIGLSRCTRQ